MTETVESLMTPAPAAVGMDEPLWRVRERMEEGRFHHLLVEEGGRLVGLVSDRDVLAALSPAADSPFASRADALTLARPVHLVMARRLVAVAPQVPVLDAARMLLDHEIHCLPVVDGGGRCVGILTATDVLRWCVAALEPARAA